MSDEFYNRGNKSQRLIINKVSKKVIGNALVTNLDEIIDKVGVQLIGVIPEAKEILSRPIQKLLRHSMPYPRDWTESLFR